MNRFRLPIAALLVVCLIPSSAGLAQDVFFSPDLKTKDIDLTLGVDWYGVYLQGKKDRPLQNRTDSAPAKRSSKRLI